ncbi:unnamed protein product [Brachionus calyciflorus]|uniref:Uncharacterized protein n=1 Tax=Brachionus calyciflorus TaxID=104777 RepID=A0A813TSA3_9BILA|nr:unnamed protein product [Brachionus calyciflorus]
MAFLLGDESCIESLRSDLKDIQQTIDEIIVRTGIIKCYSWKSPDKLATELKINELLERYSYGDDEVDNQVAHYSLLELIIDRLLLLIYISTNYAEQTVLPNESPASGSRITRLSAGLAIKKYWNKYTGLCSSYRQLSSETKTVNFKKNSIDLTKTEKNSIKTPIRASSAKQISDEISNKSVQTNETAFVPCESCAKVQTNLKQNADQIINMCHYQNIQSQVGKFRSNLMANQLVGGWLSGQDLEKWLVEQDKDLTKISKQIEFLSKNNELLKNKINENEETIKKMSQSEKDLKKELRDEKDTREITVKQYEKKLNDLKMETQKKITNLESEIKNLNQIKINLEEKNENLKNLYDNNEKIVVELNETNRMLSSELNTNTEHRLKIVQLEEEKLVLNKELDCLRRELSDKTTDLNNERTKLENLIRTDQSLKLKHESTLESMDKLSAEHESLKKKFDYIDEEKRQLIDSFKHKESQIENLRYESEILQGSITNLKLELKKMKDNESLLIRYPDLYGPMEQLNDDELSVIDDMQNQIKANKHRISLLENLNNKLFNSIKKLNETQGTNEITNDIGASFDDKNYFMKPNESSSRSQSRLDTPKQSDNNYSFSRPVPLFKLDNEIEIETKTESNESSLKKYWNQHESVDKIDKNEPDSDDEFDFLKEKRESDKNYLEKLNQISQGTDLRIENSDISIVGRSRRGSKDSQNPYLFSPSTSSLTSHSRVSQHSAYGNRSNLKTPPIPPADKNMEVIVGKGRRVNSATNSARSNISSNNIKQNTSINSKRVESARGKPPPASGKTSSTGFKCDNCNKKYEDSKNLEIHKLYCTK